MELPGQEHDGHHGEEDQGRPSAEAHVRTLAEVKKILELRRLDSLEDVEGSTEEDIGNVEPDQEEGQELDDGLEGDGEDQAFVFLVEEGKAVRRDVKTGISSDSDQEILDGLDEGDTVVSGPFRVLRHLNEGDAVEQLEEEEEGDSAVTVSVS